MSYLAEHVCLSDVEVEVGLLGTLPPVNRDTAMPVATAVGAREGEGGRGREREGTVCIQLVLLSSNNPW